MAEIVTEGERAIPARPLELGYTFAHPDLDEALADALRLTQAVVTLSGSSPRRRAAHFESDFAGQMSQTMTPMKLSSRPVPRPDLLAVALVVGQPARDDRRAEPEVEEPEGVGSDAGEDHGHAPR